MNILRITSADDPRVTVYTGLKDRELARTGNRFIAQGEWCVRRLIDSRYPVESIFVQENKAEEFAALVPPTVPVYTAAGELMRSVLGFQFHTGALACGRREGWDPLEQICQPDNALVVVCPDLNNAENLGGIIRLAAGFGAAGLVIGPRSVDPFYRQSIRVSMGNIFKLPIHQTPDVIATLKRMREEFGVQTIATVCQEGAESLETIPRAPKIAILFGEEAQGLPTEIAQVCARRVTIPMQMGTDSLNVAVAAGITLYHFARVAGAKA